MKFSTLALAGLVGAVAALPTLDGDHDGECVVVTDPTVVIDTGKIVGTTTALPEPTGTNKVEVNKFLGIPYAAPPKRWEKATKAEKWADNVALLTQKYPPACMQQFNYPESTRAFTLMAFNDPPPVESENCLFLNVFQPSSPAPEEGFPVMFWIYGGGLQFGSSGQPAYDGSWMAAREDVIVVTINYRTNIFGFPASPELDITERNLGLFDQRFALEWVQNNIAAFQGNPKKVTIFGESAGALSVDALVTTYGPSDSDNPPPFHAAILQSGQASLSRFMSRANSTANWLEMVEKVGCADAPSHIECARGVKATTIKEVIERNALSFPPVQDDVTLSSEAAERRERNEIADVPILAGTNANEGRIFNVGQTNLTRYLDNLVPVPALQAAIRAAYPIGTEGLETDYDVISAIYTDLIYTCPQSKHAAASAAAGYPTWRYFYTPTFDNLNRAASLGIDLKAYHAAEIPMVFGTYPKQGFTEQQVELSAFMMKAWTSFAKNPSQGPGWERLDDGDDYGVLGLDGDAGVQLRERDIADFNCDVFEPLYAALNSRS